MSGGDSQYRRSPIHAPVAAYPITGRRARRPLPGGRGAEAPPLVALHHAAGNRATGALLQRRAHKAKASHKDVDVKTAERVMAFILQIVNQLSGSDPSSLPGDAVPAEYRELLSLWYELTYGKDSNRARTPLEGDEFLSRYGIAMARTEPILVSVLRGGGGQWRKLLQDRWYPKYWEFERRNDSQTRVLELLKGADPVFWGYRTPEPVPLEEFLEAATKKHSLEVPLQRPGGAQVGTAKAGLTYYASQQEPRLLLWACPGGVFFSLGDQIYKQSLDGFSEDIILGAFIKAAQDVAPFVELITVVVDIAISITPVGPLYDLTLASKAAAEGNWKEAALNLLPHVPLGRLAKLTRVGRAAFKVGSKGVGFIERAVAGAATFAGRGFGKIAGKLRRGIWIAAEAAEEGAGKKAFYFLDEAEKTPVWRKVPKEEAEEFIRCTECALTNAGKEGAGTAGTRYERTYRINGDAAEIAKSQQGYQVYEYRNKDGQLLYVGKSGGAGGKKPMNWTDRLKNEHIQKEWIGEATTITVTSELGEQEAFALEEVLIPEAKYNVRPGEHSTRFPQGGTSASGLAASKHGSRYRFTLDVMF